MHIVSCLHPVKLTIGKYNGLCLGKTEVTINVPCGKCVACRNSFANDWKQRIIYESTFHKYGFFWTLTYREEDVPFAYFDNDFVMMYDRSKSDASGYAGRFLFEPEEDEILDLFNYDFFNDNKDNKLLLRCGCKKHVQDFIKRFREHAERKFNEKIRYYAVCEYGSRTMRPHYHGIFWFDSLSLAKSIFEIIHSCWPYGRIDVSPCGDDVSGYVSKVARYVTGSSYLPQIYDRKELRPFYLASRRPAIGVPPVNKETVQELVYSEDHRISYACNSAIKNSTYFRSIENRFFPKCREFGALSHQDRIARYRLYETYAVSSRDDYKKALDGVRLFLKDKSKYDQFINDLNISKRVYELSNLLCGAPNIDHYVKLIESYYKDKEYFQLQHFYEFQEDYLKQVDARLEDLANMYTTNRQDLIRVFDRDVGKYYGDIVYQKMIDDYSTDKYDKMYELVGSGRYPALVDTRGYQDFYNLHHKIYKDGQKTKYQNDVNGVLNHENYSY